jgi:hypothetical protein
MMIMNYFKIVGVSVLSCSRLLIKVSPLETGTCCPLPLLAE